MPFAALVGVTNEGGDIEVISVAGTHHFSVMETFQDGELWRRAEALL